MNEIFEQLKVIYSKACLAIQTGQDVAISPDEGKALLRFFVLVNMNATLEEIGVFPRHKPDPKTIDDMAEALQSLSLSLKKATNTASHLKPNKAN